MALSACREMGLPMIVVLNMIDIATRAGIEINIKEFSKQYFSKELTVAMISGTIISMFLLLYHSVMYQQYQVGLAISISIIVVILFAATLGTLVPLFLHRNKIDPAIATGPFITTTNDVFGIVLYFAIARLILGF